jgi:hypothetical protein
MSAAPAIERVPVRWDLDDDDDQHVADAARHATSTTSSTPIGWNELNLTRFLALGATISVSCDALLYPFDLIKTRQMVSGLVCVPLLRCVAITATIDLVAATSRSDSH